MVRKAKKYSTKASAWWLEITLENTPVALERLLEISYPVLDRIDVYVMKGETRFETFLMGTNCLSSTSDPTPLFHCSP